MKRSAPLFLARNSYRRRRLTDAARMLPLVGMVLFFIPILWQPATTPGDETAEGGVYLFAVWLGLIVAAFVLARALAPVTNPGPDTAQQPEDLG
jgi:hypothetical protein